MRETRTCRLAVSGQVARRYPSQASRALRVGISARLDHFCDEATFVDWEQASPDLPDWQTSWRHLTADGTAADLTHASPANQTRDFPAPVEPPRSVS
jgi:hypothetical protein